MLHGCTQNPVDFARGTRMNELAQARGWLALYPGQIRKANARVCWNWFSANHQHRDKGEPLWIVEAVRALIAGGEADPQRIFVAGLSAGGAMAANLAFLFPDLFAGVGVHSGLAPMAAGGLPSALLAMKGLRLGGKPLSTPAIVFQGDRDSVVSPRNFERLLQRPGLPPAVTREGLERGRMFTCSTIRDGDRPVCEGWMVHGLDHAWSGGNPEGSYADSLGPSASQEMLRFFEGLVPSPVAGELSAGV